MDKHVRKDNLAVDDDRAVDVGAEHGLADGIEVALQGGGGVADGDAGVNLVKVVIGHDKVINNETGIKPTTIKLSCR